MTENTILLYRKLFKIVRCQGLFLEPLQYFRPTFYIHLKSTYWLPLSVLIHLSVSGQYKTSSILPAADFSQKVAISGLVFYADNLYLITENCATLHKAHPNAHTTIKMALSTDKRLELEGISVYRDHFYFVSENTSAVYESPASGGKLTPVVMAGITIPAFNPGVSDGLEGIATNENHNKFYLLLERHAPTKKAIVYTLRMDTLGGERQLTLEKTDSLDLPSDKWRYTDIYYDSYRNRLLCLKSFYENKSGKYAVETIRVNSQGYLTGTPEMLEGLDTVSLTEQIKRYERQNYSSNMEGITCDKNGTIYLVSDNCEGKEACSNCKTVDNVRDIKKTLVLKLYK